MNSAVHTLASSQTGNSVEGGIIIISLIIGVAAALFYGIRMLRSGDSTATDNTVTGTNDTDPADASEDSAPRWYNRKYRNPWVVGGCIIALFLLALLIH